MQIVFMGYQTWGYRTLEAILGARHRVPLVITHPQSQHEYEKIWSDSVAELAAQHSISTIECMNANTDEVYAAISQQAPDVIVSSDWRTWLSPKLFSIAKLATINIHDALLPRYGGFAPINWAIANGETETGVTVHFVEYEFDLGDIILQERVPIHFEDTATEIFHKTLSLFPKLTLEALDLLEKDAVTRIPQDRRNATFYHKRSKRDSLIDWEKSPVDIYNLIRAQSDPYPNAHTLHKGMELRIKKAHLPGRSYCGTPGRIFTRTEDGVVVLCGPRQKDENQGLVVERLQRPGQEPVDAVDYFERMGGYLGG